MGKEQIKCKYMFQDKEKFDGKPYCTCFNELCEDISIICDHNCQIYEDYKQLARKTQEAEKYKKLAADFKDVNKQLGYKYLTIKDECEELKKQLKTSEKWRVKSESLNEKLDIENTRYRKECDELEKQLETSEKWRIKAESLNEKLDIENTRYRKECEELKKTVLTKCPNCNSEYLTSKGIELYEENKKLKKECENLEARVRELEEKLKITEEHLDVIARGYHFGDDIEKHLKLLAEQALQKMKEVTSEL